MEHSFDTNLAKLYGVNCALVIKNIQYWCKINEENKVNYFENRYWVFNSVSQWQKILFYLTPKQIRLALKKSEKEGLIITGNFNKKKYDRTTWYAISDRCSAILLKGQMEVTKKANGFAQKDKPIPDINPNINSDTNIVFNKKELKENKLNSLLPKKEVIPPFSASLEELEKHIIETELKEQQNFNK